MDFEKELENRLIYIKQARKKEQKMTPVAKHEQEIILKTKEIIDPILQSVAKMFTNAKTEPTHYVTSSGEVIFKLGIGSCCFIDFYENINYGFALPCRVGFHIKVKDFANETIEIRHAYVSSLDAFKSYSIIFEAFERDSRLTYYGKFNSEEIKQAVEKAILSTLDVVRVIE